jgi:hypothetical protein
MTVTTHRITSGRPPAFSAENLAGQSHRGEENEQEEIGEPLGELDRRAAELVEQGRHEGDEQPADHGCRYAEPRKQGNTARDCGRNHESEQTHRKGLKLGQRNRHHASPSSVMLDGCIMS